MGPCPWDTDRWQVFGLLDTAQRPPTGRRFPAFRPVRLTPFVSSYRCGGSSGFTPDSLFARPRILTCTNNKAQHIVGQLGGQH